MSLIVMAYFFPMDAGALNLLSDLLFDNHTCIFVNVNAPSSHGNFLFLCFLKPRAKSNCLLNIILRIKCKRGVKRRAGQRSRACTIVTPPLWNWCRSFRCFRPLSNQSSSKLTSVRADGSWSYLKPQPVGTFPEAAAELRDREASTSVSNTCKLQSQSRRPYGRENHGEPSVKAPLPDCACTSWHIDGFMQSSPLTGGGGSLSWHKFAMSYGGPKETISGHCLDANL